MANINDKFIKSVMAPPTKLSSSMSASSDVVTVESMDGWMSDTAVLAAIDRVDSLGNLTPDKMEIVLGVISETGLFNVKRGIGGNVQSHSAGSVVELSIAGAEQWNRAMNALIGAFGQDGKIKESAFASDQQVVDGANIKDSSIEPTKLSPETFRVKAGPETLTPYRWVNGEEIYQVYTSFNTASHPDNFEQIAEISNMPPAPDIKLIVSVEGGLMVSGTDDFWPVGYRNRIAPNNQDFEVKISKVGSKWQARYFTGGAGVANLVIRYVKK